MTDDRATPLLDMPALARRCGVQRVLLKAENERALGNFKSLGGAAAVERMLRQRDWPNGGAARLLCASDGNHGLAVAVAARRFGVSARVYLPASIERWRIERIEREQAEVILVNGSYDDGVACAHAASRAGEGRLVADTSDDANDETVRAVMDGYRSVAREVDEQLKAANLPRPTHLFVQAGVGGFAAAMVAGLKATGMHDFRMVVVEPQAAACVAAALAAGRVVQIQGDLRTCAGMLSCGRASASALATLLAHSARSTLVDETQLVAAPEILKEQGIVTTPSGAAGLAGLIEASSDAEFKRSIALDERSSVLLFATEAGRELRTS